MRYELSFYSTEIEAATLRGGQLSIRCAAAHVYRRAPDGSELAGYAGGLEICFEHALIDGDLAACVGGIADGWLTHDGVRLGRVALPLALEGPLVWECRLINGSIFEVRATTVRCDAPGPDRFIESFAC
ncbi:hypothetical protein OPU71_14915 [Niveibacterium sp. 24ML]|uniref:hypothetical protein n=1 Tax=Niveibacterium sp. 24ML TaxID=2985512 RepID=UPI00227005CF|nr:hypothetical protein [Niveibacterium sp. 24ML]MCX9157417.1 hypothetical protein [Niveibacterium sp. 24ML]